MFDLKDFTIIKSHHFPETDTIVSIYGYEGRYFAGSINVAEWSNSLVCKGEFAYLGTEPDSSNVRPEDIFEVEVPGALALQPAGEMH